MPSVQPHRDRNLLLWLLDTGTSNHILAIEMCPILDRHAEPLVQSVDERVGERALS